MSISNKNKILKIGNAPCSWGIYYPKNNYLKYDKYIKKISEIGYQYSELGPLGYFNDEISIIKDHLNRNNIHISGATHVHSFANLSNFDELKSEINKISKILLKLNSSNLIIMDDSNFYFKNISRKINIYDWKIILQNIIKIKNLTENEYGINLHFHPHVSWGIYLSYFK